MVTPSVLNRRFCVAPMMDWTDRHCRTFHRLLTRHSLLYSEMVTTGAVQHGDRDRLLGFDPAWEGPVALQLGGSDPQALADSVRCAGDYGYAEMNLNVGCPSDRVQNGRFGACLMRTPDLVAQCVEAMVQATALPVTVKSRIGVDDQDAEVAVRGFVKTLANAGCRTFIIHARKAWLQGLSPKENRDIPPLNYDLVYALKQENPTLEIIINGGIATLEECVAHLDHVDGVMVGRAAYHTPELLQSVDAVVYGDTAAAPVCARDVMARYLHYIEHQRARGVALAPLVKPLLGLFSGQRGARAWRQYLSENAHRAGAGADVVRMALRHVGVMDASEEASSAISGRQLALAA